MAYNFTNPYTFLPIKDSKPNREKLGKGNLTGRISCSLEIHSPTFIPNTSKEFNVNGNAKAYDFFSYENLSKEKRFPKNEPKEPRIPGSEIRGMLRNIYEQLTNSCFSVVDDKNLTHMRTSLPKKAGLWDMRTGRIIPCEKVMLNTGHTNFGCKVFKNQFASGEKVVVTKSKNRFRGKKHMPYYVESICSFEADTNKGDVGYVVIGESFRNKHHDAVFLFPTNTRSESETVDEKDIERFEFLLTKYKKYNSYKKTYYSYKNAIKNEEDGEYYLPVYYNIQNNIIYMSPACVTREIFNHTISDILRENHFEHQPCDGKEGKWCPACRLFGKIGQDGEGNALASRIRVCDSEIFGVGENKKKASFETPIFLPILGKPNYSASEFYLQEPHLKNIDQNGMVLFKKEENARHWNYDYYILSQDNAFPIRESDKKSKDYAPRLVGRKVYWLGEDKHSQEQATVNTSMQTKVRCLKGGSCDFQIYFEDLTEEELKLLLWCIELEEDCFHRIGRGKPYGMGAVRLKVNGITKVEYSINDNKVVREEKGINIDCLKVRPDSSEFNKTKQDMLHYMKKITENVDYPRNVKNGPIYKWFSDNKGNKLSRINIKEILAPYPQKGTIKRKE